VFDIPPGEIDAGEILSAAIKLMYKFHLPREIRVSGDFEGRLELARRLGERFGREVKIKVVPVQSLGVTAGRALFKSRIDRDINLLTKPEPVERTANRIKNMFGLSGVPKLIEAYDVAHISSTTFVAARVVHDIKARRTSEFEYINSTPKAEPAALAELVAKTHSSGDDRGAHLVLVDGGKTQLNAALGVLPPRGKRTFRVISAVKPPGKHSAISHFLTEDGDRIDFDVSIGAHRLLLGIRDQVHELSNSVHRLTRDMSGFYELAGILPSFSEAERQALVTEVGSIRRITDMSDEKISEMFDTKTAKRLIGDLARFRAGESAEVLPLVVPVRYDELDGEADDLRPIATRVGSAPQ
jgi:excinuclease ABC subunit C